jgi:hypothetical protein
VLPRCALHKIDPELLQKILQKGSPEQANRSLRGVTEDCKSASALSGQPQRERQPVPYRQCLEEPIPQTPAGER